jgi:hypothetical protein
MTRLTFSALALAAALASPAFADDGGQLGKIGGSIAKRAQQF